MFLITPWFKFLDLRNYFAPDLSYDGWCKVNGCSLEMLVFPHEWLDDYKRLSHVRPVLQEAFFSKLKGNITHDKFDKFSKT